jgi:hypothetical protein
MAPTTLMPNLCGVAVELFPSQRQEFSCLGMPNAFTATLAIS